MNVMWILLTQYTHVHFYEYDSTKRFLAVTTEVEKAKAKYLTKDNGRDFFKDGYNMENV